MEMNPYELLGVKPGASKEEIRRSYLKLMKLYHPDSNRDASALEMCKAINSAYDMLKARENTEEAPNNQDESPRHSERRIDFSEFLDKIIFYDGTYIVGERNKKVGLLSKDGHVLVDFNYNSITIEDKKVIIFTQFERDGKSRIINYTQILMDYGLKKKIVRRKTKGVGDAFFFWTFDNCIRVLDNDLKTKDLYDYNLNLILKDVKINGDFAYSGNQEFYVKDKHDEYILDNTKYFSIRDRDNEYKLVDEQGRVYSRKDLNISEVRDNVRISWREDIQREDIKKNRRFFNKFYLEDYWLNDVSWLKIEKNNKRGLYIKTAADTKYKKIFQCKYDYIDIINEETYVIKNDQRCGVINSKGVWLIEPKYGDIEFELYDNCIYIMCYSKDHDYTTIYDEKYNCIYEGKGYVWKKQGEFRIAPQMVGCNIKNETIDLAHNLRELIDNNDLSLLRRIRLNETMEINHKKIVKNRKGYTFYINESGDSVTFDKIFKFYNGLAIVKSKEGYGVIDSNGKILIDTKYKSISNFINGCAVGTYNNEKVILLKTNRNLIEIVAEEYIGQYGNLHILKRDGKYGIVKDDGKEIFHFEYELMWPIKKLENEQGYICVEKEGKQGIISSNGSIVFNPIWDEIKYFNKDIFVLKNNKNKIIKMDYKQYEFTNLYTFQYSGKAELENIYIVENHNKYIIIDNKLNVVTEELKALNCIDYLNKLFNSVIGNNKPNLKIITLLNKLQNINIESYLYS